MLPHKVEGLALPRCDLVADVVEPALHRSETLTELSQALSRLLQRIRVAIHTDHARLREYVEKVFGVATGTKGSIDNDGVGAERLYSWGQEFGHAVAHDRHMPMRVCSVCAVHHPGSPLAVS